MSHSFTVSNNQVYSKDEFDLWHVYSAERFRAPWPSLGGRKEQYLKKKTPGKAAKIHVLILNLLCASARNSPAHNLYICAWISK